MDIYSIIKQITEQLSNSSLEEERLKELTPIDFVLYFPNQKGKEAKWEILCYPILERDKISNDLEVKNFIIDNKKLYKVSSTNISRWSDRISDNEAATIEFYFSDLMKKFGYGAYFNEKMQVESASEFYKWSNYKYYFKDRFAMGLKKQINKG